MLKKIFAWLFRTRTIQVIVLIILGVSIGSYFFAEYIIQAIPFIKNKSGLKIFAGMVLVLVIISIYLQYKFKDDINLHFEEKQISDSRSKLRQGVQQSGQNGNPKIPIEEKESHLHYHSSYAHIAIFFITVIGLILSAYADVFYQQGDAIAPIANGINHNRTEIALEVESGGPDTNNLIFILDVSKSLKVTRSEPLEWVKREKSLLIKSCRRESPVAKKLNALFSSDAGGLISIKFKACQLLRHIRDSLANAVAISKVAIWSFANYADIEGENFILTDRKSYESAINCILDLDFDPGQSDSTIFPGIFDKLLEYGLIPGPKNVFNHQRNAVTILSDFKHDMSSPGDSSVLPVFLDSLASRSVFCNLFLLKTTPINKKKELNMVEVFEQTFDPRFLQRFDVDSATQPSYSYNESDTPITFLISKPFYVKESKVQFTLARGRSVNVTMKLVGKEDPRQQFHLNGKQIRLGKEYSLAGLQGGGTLSFSGHAPEQFSGISARFNYSHYSKTISREIIFKKLLPVFIARTIFCSSLFIFLISLLYICYLLSSIFGLFRASSKTKEEVVRPEAANTPKSISLRKHKGEYLIPCTVKSNKYQVVVGEKNIVSKAEVMRLKNSSETDDEIETKILFNPLVSYDVSIDGQTENTEFEVSEDCPHSFCFSKSLLESLGFDPDISDGKLKYLQ